ncbi:hypothetical protein JOC77_003587 [Peribacillus deserti]|uniref:UBC core domain-containing protein n=1 Tax=Peribacillus deserti TaxID=673318 RepID=A0ABS2QLU3_9BACI|nr:hypothetical protein [Peribacillus deserti]MBM7694143.1 hypothetical protein [Peribacillus deserti]
MRNFDHNPRKHPTITRCLQHLSVLGADEKTKQIVYMYMESLYRDLAPKSIPADDRNLYISKP